MDGQSKVQLILELKNRMKTGLTKAKQSVNSNVSAMKKRFTDFKLSAVSSLKSIASEVPIVGRAFQLLKNPIVMASAAVIGLTMLFGNATNAAGDFYHEFLPIQQLNLDKPQAELEAYRNKILDVSMTTGQSANDTAKAFYDIQSATGLFGQDVADITTKVGNFSLATGAALPDSVNATVKAMKAFGLGVEDIDGLLASNAKTVQVGITTFDELAKVQTEYAGSAAAAGQNVDTANKIFAAFTSIAKDSTTAATMTKTAFQGLTQKSTIEGLESIGVSMYDAQGNMRDLSGVLVDVRNKFKQMSPKEIDELINKVGGPEGLRNLFGKLKTGADDFFETMEAYDTSAFDLDKALKNARGDFNVLKGIVGNQINTLMIKLGEKFLPKVAMGIEWISNLLTRVYENFDTIWAVVRNVGAALIAAKAAMIIFNIITAANPIGAIVMGAVLLITYITIAVKKFDSFGAAMLMLLGPLGIILNIGLNIKKQWESISNAFTEGGFIAGIKRLGLVIIDALVMPVQQLLTMIGKIPGMKFAENWAGKVEDFRKNVLGIDTSVRLNKKEKEAEEDEIAQGVGGKGAFATTDGATVPGAVPTGADAVSKITGSAKQIKNITINIDSFVKGGINTEHTEVANMNAGELEEWFNNMMLRVIRNVELSY